MTEEGAPIELFATGIAGLDDVLGDGMARNHLYLIEGDPGTGKSTLAMQFLMEVSGVEKMSVCLTVRVEGRTP